LESVLTHPEIAPLVKQAQASGTSFWQIIVALLPVIASILSGGGFNLAQIIALIESLINPPPTPVPVTHSWSAKVTVPDKKDPMPGPCQPPTPKKGDSYYCAKCGMALVCTRDCACTDPSCVILQCCGAPLTKC